MKDIVDGKWIGPVLYSVFTDKNMFSIKNLKVFDEYGVTIGVIIPVIGRLKENEINIPFDAKLKIDLFALCMLIGSTIWLKIQI